MPPVGAKVLTTGYLKITRDLGPRARGLSETLDQPSVLIVLIHCFLKSNDHERDTRPYGSCIQSDCVWCPVRPGLLGARSGPAGHRQRVFRLGYCHRYLGRLHRRAQYLGTHRGHGRLDLDLPFRRTGRASPSDGVLERRHHLRSGHPDLAREGAFLGWQCPGQFGPEHRFQWARCTRYRVPAERLYLQRSALRGDGDEYG